MPLDSQIRVIIEQIVSKDAPPRHILMPAVARVNQERNMLYPPGPEVAKVEDRLIPVSGGDIPIRVYTPTAGGPFPILVWFHGGGWVLGNVDLADGSCRRLAVGADCVVVSVGYRLAPENKFPAAADDCYAATVWASENAASINADGSRVAVGGDSAGGNLAAAISLMARDKGGPRLVHQLLVYPVIERDFGTKSYEENANGYQLTRDDMVWFWDHYLRDESDAANPYAAPTQAKDLSGLPPALVVTAEYDPLRDEGEAYAQRLKQAGVSTTCIRYDGMIHGFFRLASLIDKGKDATSQACSALKDAFAR